MFKSKRKKIIDILKINARLMHIQGEINTHTMKHFIELQETVDVLDEEVTALWKEVQILKRDAKRKNVKASR